MTGISLTSVTLLKVLRCSRLKQYCKRENLADSDFCKISADWQILIKISTDRQIC